MMASYVADAVLGGWIAIKWEIRIDRQLFRATAEISQKWKMNGGET